MISSALRSSPRAASIAMSALFATTITPAAAARPPRIIMSQCSCLNSTSGRRREPARLIYLWGSPTSEMGQKRRFDRRPVTSGLPREADTPSDRQHFSKVPRPEVKNLIRSARGRLQRDDFRCLTILSRNDTEQIRPAPRRGLIASPPISNVPLPRPLQPTLQRRPLGR